MARHRMTTAQSELFMLRKLHDKKLYKLLVFSDVHGWLADLKTLRCINKILQYHKFDEVCINGDLVDMPYLSRHAKKLYEDGILKGYSELKEIEYTKEQVLVPLRASTDAEIRIRLGNHDERLTKPFLLSKGQLASLAILQNELKAIEYDKMLCLDEMEMTYDDSPRFSYFGEFDVVHGLSLAKNAPEKNFQTSMSSGTTGHSHRLGVKYMTTAKGQYSWFESGCTRIKEEVEYLPTGNIADWQHGFVTVYFMKQGDEVQSYAQLHAIHDGKCYYEGVLYNGEDAQSGPR